jgi:hypothetical protein
MVLGVISFIILIVIMAYGFKSYMEKETPDYEIKWPETLSNCPDYWTDVGEGKFQNSYILGTCPGPGGVLTPNGVIDFSTAQYKNTAEKPNGGSKQRCIKSKQCGITWDGIDHLCA